MFDIFKSLAITLLISSLTTAICYQFFNMNIYGVFTLTTLVQFTASWFLRTYIQHIEQTNIRKQQSELITQIENEATDASCAYCGENNLIPISSNTDNDFNCLSCGKPNSVYVQITIAQKSVPIDSQPYEVTNYNNKLADAKNKILGKDV